MIKVMLRAVYFLYIRDVLLTIHFQAFILNMILILVWNIKDLYVFCKRTWECDFYVTMSKMAKFQNIKNRKKRERRNIFDIGNRNRTCAKLRIICATCAINFKKSVIVLLPFAFTVNGNNPGSLFQK